MKTDYFFFNPFNKQYYFPRGFRNYKLFTSFYQPYTFKGKLLWNAWLNISLFRNLCKEKKPFDVLPLLNLKEYIPSKVLLAFNKGTSGPEQKTTILGVNLHTKEEFFIKYGETKLAKKNIDNEGKVLLQLKHLNFVPKLQDYINKEKFTLLKTSVLNGQRYTDETINDAIIEVLKILPNQNITTYNRNDKGLKFSFAHGDFCPWNIMKIETKIFVFDWELAGVYPYGYDLFTFIFQTAFLLHPNTDVKEIYQKNQKQIKNLFILWNIPCHIPYLIAFAEIKLELEIKKNNNILIPFYKKLINYAKTI